jgi:riboflavin kinase
MAKRTKTLAAEGCFLQKITFNGTVYSGAGEGKKFIDLLWVKRQIQEKLGFTPYSGTLNIHLNKESVMQKKLLKKAVHLPICPEKGYCTGILIKAQIEGLDCGIIIPQIPNYASDVLEVVAAWCLRERLKLVDGTKVAVMVHV